MRAMLAQPGAAGEGLADGGQRVLRSALLLLSSRLGRAAPQNPQGEAPCAPGPSRSSLLEPMVPQGEAPKHVVPPGQAHWSPWSPQVMPPGRMVLPGQASWSPWSLRVKPPKHVVPLCGAPWAHGPSRSSPLEPIVLFLMPPTPLYFCHLSEIWVILRFGLLGSYASLQLAANFNPRKCRYLQRKTL